jgi:hypothetical protein
MFHSTDWIRALVLPAFGSISLKPRSGTTRSTSVREAISSSSPRSPVTLIALTIQNAV